MSYRPEFEGDALVQLNGLPSAVFGAGYGLLSFRVDDVTEVIRIFDILWVG